MRAPMRSSTRFSRICRRVLAEEPREARRSAATGARTRGASRPRARPRGVTRRDEAGNSRGTRAVDGRSGGPRGRRAAPRRPRGRPGRPRADSRGPPAVRDSASRGSEVPRNTGPSLAPGAFPGPGARRSVTARATVTLRVEPSRLNFPALVDRTLRITTPLQGPEVWRRIPGEPTIRYAESKSRDGRVHEAVRDDKSAGAPRPLRVAAWRGRSSLAHGFSRAEGTVGSPATGNTRHEHPTSPLPPSSTAGAADQGRRPTSHGAVLQTAILIEQQVEARYLRVGRAFTYGPIRRLFEEYAAEVRDHARILSRHLRDREDGRALAKQSGVVVVRAPRRARRS